MKNLNNTILSSIGLILLGFTLGSNFFQDVNTSALVALIIAIFLAILLSVVFYFINQRRR